MLLGDRYSGAAGSGGLAHGDVSHVSTRLCTLPACCCTAQGGDLAAARPAPSPQFNHTDREIARLQQHSGSAWAGDGAQGEGRFDAQHSGRGAAQQAILPDPKEDANRVIEDILSVSAFLGRPVLCICSSLSASSTLPSLSLLSCQSLLVRITLTTVRQALEEDCTHRSVNGSGRAGVCAEKQCEGGRSCMDTSLWGRPAPAPQICAAAGRPSWALGYAEHLCCAPHQQFQLQLPDGACLSSFIWW